MQNESPEQLKQERDEARREVEKWEKGHKLEFGDDFGVNPIELVLALKEQKQQLTSDNQQLLARVVELEGAFKQIKKSFVRASGEDGIYKEEFERCMSLFKNVLQPNQTSDSLLRQQELERDCGNPQCKQVHQFLDSMLEGFGLSKDGVSFAKSLRLAGHIQELERKAKALEWLHEHGYTANAIDYFDCGMDLQKLLDAIEAAMKGQQ